MIGFDLGEIVMESGLTTGISKIADLSHYLSSQTTGYLSNIQNLRDGRRPKEGRFIQDSPALTGFVADTLLNLRNLGDIYIAKMYSDQVFELMVGSGYIPIAWLHKNYPEDAATILGTFKNLWDAMLTDYAGMNIRKDFIYMKFKAFGMFTCKVDGYSKERLLYFLIPNGHMEEEFLNGWILENGIHEVVVMTEREYSTFLMNPNYNFLFKFDKSVDIVKGITFTVSTDLKSTVPTYIASIGCDHMCFFPYKEDDNQYNVKTNRYIVKEFQRGETLQLIVSLPENHIIDFITINGIPYFFGTAEMQAAGIMITENDKMLFTSYKSYNVTISGLRESVKIYIDACEDMTGHQITKKMINTNRSTATFGDSDATISIVFNNPFIYLNTEKIKVYAKKDAYSDEELITTKEILVDGYGLVSRKAVFGTTVFSDIDVEHQNYINRNQFIPGPHPGPMSGPKPMDTPWNPDPNKKRDNPFIISYLPSPEKRARRLQNEVGDVNPESRAILFNVTECGNIIIIFDGYSDYKFFRVAFDERAMVSVLKVAGHVDDIDMIPVIEDFAVINPNVTEEPEPSTDDASGDNQSGESGESSDNTNSSDSSSTNSVSNGDNNNTSTEDESTLTPTDTTNNPSSTTTTTDTDIDDLDDLG